MSATQYAQLKSDDDYKSLGKLIAENTQSVYGLVSTHLTFEEGRLIYMAIPPIAYARTAQLVNSYLRPQIGRPWFKVVLEKPFGHNKESAQHLNKRLSKYFKDEEIYRIDHYLGKSVVRLILQFR